MELVTNAKNIMKRVKKWVIVTGDFLKKINQLIE
jgi:hypothetical protein